MTTIANLRSLMERATPGPWQRPEGECDTFGECPLQLAYAYEGWRDDADLIVAMRNALPKLLVIAESAQWMAKNGMAENADCDVFWDRHAAYVLAALADLEKP